MGEVVEYAVRGDSHRGPAPSGIPDWMTGGSDVALIPWLCPRCEHVVAETVALAGRPDPLSVISDFSPTRHVDADLDGVPFFGPSRRAMRGKTERRSLPRLAREASRRNKYGDDILNASHGLIRFGEFDTICEKCPRRVRVKLY